MTKSRLVDELELSNASFPSFVSAKQQRETQSWLSVWNQWAWARLDLLDSAVTTLTLKLAGWYTIFFVWHWDICTLPAITAPPPFHPIMTLSSIIVDGIIVPRFKWKLWGQHWTSASQWSVLIGTLYWTNSYSRWNLDQIFGYRWRKALIASTVTKMGDAAQ